MATTTIAFSARADSIDDIERHLGSTTSVRGAISETLTETVRVAEQEIELNEPEGRTRGLKRATSSKPARAELDGTIQASAGVGEVPAARGSRRYPYDVHEGTGLFGHLHRRITGSAGINGHPMRIPTPTGIFFAQSTRGQEPQPFVAEALPPTEAYLEQRFDLMVRRILGD